LENDTTRGAGRLAAGELGDVEVGGAAIASDAFGLPHAFDAVHVVAIEAAG
jgi:high-affinity nickel permease